MATIDYKCDTCKRERTLTENQLGMTVFAKCIITEGCKGTLYKVARNENIARQVSDFPPAVAGLNDYVERRAFYQETINITSNPWKVEHNLGVSPAVTVYLFDEDDNATEIPPDEYVVTVVDKNNIQIQFSNPQRGIVHLIARSSVPRDVDTVPDDATLFQVSHLGWMDFGSVSVIDTEAGLRFLTNDDFDLQVEVQIPSRPVTTVSGENRLLLDAQEQTSPWFGWEQVLIRKRRNFTTKNMDVLELFRLAFGESTFPTLSDIPNGSSFEIQQIRYRNEGSGFLSEFEQIEPRSLLLLLANDPYGVVDKIRNQLIDVGELPLATNGRFFVFDGEVFIDSSNIERIYPRIEQANADNLLTTPTPTPSVTVTQTVTPTITPTTTPPTTAGTTPTPTATPPNTPDSTPPNTPPVTPGDTPAITPTISVTPDVTPDGTPPVTPPVTPGDTPPVTPPVTPDGTPPVTPDGTPPVTPDGTPPVTPDGTPPVTPDGTPPVTPDGTPPGTPPVTPPSTPAATVTPTPSDPGSPIIIPFAGLTETAVEQWVSGSPVNAGIVFMGFNDGQFSPPFDWQGSYRRETQAFDTPVQDWWSWTLYPDITTAPLSVYQDFYIYFKEVSNTGAPNFAGISDSYDTWYDLTATPSIILEDTGTLLGKERVIDIWMVYSPSSTPVSDPSVSPPAGTVYIGECTLRIIQII